MLDLLPGRQGPPRCVPSVIDMYAPMHMRIQSPQLTFSMQGKGSDFNAVSAHAQIGHYYFTYEYTMTILTSTLLTVAHL